MNRWWLLLSLFVALPARADRCGSVDLRDLLGTALDQGNSSYCYAHAASSLIEAKLGVRVSPMQLATDYFLTSPADLTRPVPGIVREYHTAELIEFWRHDVRSSAENFTPSKILGEEGLLDTGGEEWPLLLIANYQGLCLESRLPTGGGDTYKNYLSEINSFHQERAARGIPQEELSQPLSEVTHPEARGMAWSWRHWVNSRCGARFFPSQPLLPRTISLAHSLAAFRLLDPRLASSQRNSVIDAINAQLDQGRPISIGYALSDLMPEKAGAASPEEVDHASVIAGRRERGGRCYYFVRNSFGEDLSGYHPRFSKRLERGGVWVLPEEIPSLYSAVWLE